MDEVFTESIQRPRLLAQLLATFSALALLLAAIGAYGVLAYMVAERRQEIGIRMALGAGQWRVLTDIISEGLKLTIAGVLAGTGSAVLLNRLIASLLFGVAPTDATTSAMAIPTIALIAGVACFLPWRASRRRSFRKIGTRLSLSRDASSLNGFEYAHLRVGRDDPC